MVAMVSMVSYLCEWKEYTVETAHIFVANDDEAFLDLMKVILEDEGYSVTLLHADKGIYEKVKEKRPDLLILDIVLSHHDAGWKLLDKLTLDPKTSAMP